MKFTKKVMYNDCYGGFGISGFAKVEYAKRVLHEPFKVYRDEYSDKELTEAEIAELSEEHKNTKCTHCVYHVYKQHGKILLKYNEQGQLILNDNTANVSWLDCPVFEKQLKSKNNERKINE